MNLHTSFTYERKSTKKSPKFSSSKESSKAQELKSSESQEKKVKTPVSKKQKKPEGQQPPADQKVEDDESFGLPESETVF